MISSLKSKLNRNAKNIIGWKTNRKLVAFGVDDYGNVRIDSLLARQRMLQAGLKCVSRYDEYDSLENEEDLLMLYEALNSVKDRNGNPAIFTALSVPANIDYERMRDENYETYRYETLPKTFNKLRGYERVFDLWKEGISKKLIYPQFHGREHLNVRVLMEQLRRRDKQTLISLENRSYSCFSPSPFPNIDPTLAFDFEDEKDFESIDQILIDGLNVFEEVFGFRSIYFNPPGNSLHSRHFSTCRNHGIKSILNAALKVEHQGNGRTKKSLHYLGQQNDLGQVYLIRNCVFEPSDIHSGIDWVSKTIAQIENAFMWRKPALISSHRVNFCGHIDPKNRKIGIDSLKRLLRIIVDKWPEVEFVTSNQLAELILESKK